MALKIYRGEAFEHTHENRFFDFLAEQLTILCNEQNYDWHLLGNVHVGSRELDGILIKPNAVIALDFKDYSGDLQFSEAGPWQITSPEGTHTQVKGGASVNPFVQLKRNKYALSEFFKRQFSDLDCNWGHIAAAVVFQQPVHIEFNAVPGHVNRWFHITDQQNFLRDLSNITSLGIRFDYDDQRQIPELLAISPYSVPKVRREVSTESSVRNSSNSIEFMDNSRENVENLSSSQFEALHVFQKWLNSDTRCFQLTGMTGTGKRSLLEALCHVVAKQGFEFDAIVPSKRHGHRYIGIGLDVTSVYSFLYELSPSRLEEGEFSKRKVAVHEIRELGDLSKKIIFLLDGHLYSDSELMSTDRRYGSGRLITDLLTTLKESGARIVVIGDRYQISRAGEESSLLHSNVFEHFELDSEGIELLEQVESKPGDALNELRLSLVSGLRRKRFNNLRISEGENLKLLERSASWIPDVKSTPQRDVMLMPTKDEVNKFNGAVKQRLLEHSSPIGIDVGDWIDFYNRTPVLIPDYDENDFAAEFTSLSNRRWIDSGSIGRVQEVQHRELERQELRGRSGYIELQFVRLKILVQGLGEVECRCLLNFTNSPDNEISSDESVALNVIARSKAHAVLAARKNSLPPKGSEEYKQAKEAYDLWEYETLQSMGYVSAAFVRVSHAMTVHRSQGRTWSQAWINGIKGFSGNSVSNKGYFEWLYTATLSANDCLFVQNAPLLTPLGEHISVTKSSQFVVKPIAVKIPFYYSVEKDLNSDAARIISTLNVSDNLVPIAITVNERIAMLGLAIESWKESPYRIEMVLGNDEVSIFRVIMNYDKTLTVKSFSVLAEKHSDTKPYVDSTDLPMERVMSLLQGQFIPKDIGARETFDILLPLFAKHEFVVISVTEHPYQLQITATHELGVVEFKVIFNGDGFITRMELVKANSDQVSEVALLLLENKA